MKTKKIRLTIEIEASEPVFDEATIEDLHTAIEEDANGFLENLDTDGNVSIKFDLI